MTAPEEATGAWEVWINTRRCVGSGLCAGIAPEHFAARAGRGSLVRQAVVDPDPLLLDAVACCPVEAVTVTDVMTGAEQHLP